MDLTIHEVAYHRNGSCGEGFHAIKFQWNDEGNKREMLATVFGYNPASHRDEDDPEYVRHPVYRDPHVAVLDLNIALETVAFGPNSWRGDHFTDDMYKAIDYYWENR